jgi:hypothetical protein
MSDMVKFFPAVNGSMTSKDGQRFMLHVKQEDGSEGVIAFPHAEIPKIIECAAMQVGNSKDLKGQPVVTAFQTTGFQVGRGPKGEVVLNMLVGETGKIGFLLSPEMQAEMAVMLMKSGTKH